jgi:hypothetical protein
MERGRFDTPRVIVEMRGSILLNRFDNQFYYWSNMADKIALIKDLMQMIQASQAGLLVVAK